MIHNPGGAASQEILLTTLTFAGESTQSAAALAPYNMYKIRWRNVTASQANAVRMKINDYAGAAYSYREINTATVGETGGAGFITLFGLGATSNVSNGEMIISGVAGTVSPFPISFQCFGAGQSGNSRLDDGYLQATTGEQVTKFTIVTSAGNLPTGIFKIYGVTNFG